MALAWKAGWVNALGGSNPPTSADSKAPHPPGLRGLRRLVRRSAQLGLEAVAPLLRDQQAALVEAPLDGVDQHGRGTLGVDAVPLQLVAVLEDVVDDAGHQRLVDGRGEEVAAGQEGLGAI